MREKLRPLIDIAATRPLSEDEATEGFLALFEGDATPAQIGGFLMALRTRGETVDEIAAAARVMRSKCIPVTAPDGAIDIVGTGGDGKGTLNISTATAFVVAGAGVPVAKHGNRRLSSKSGAADALTALGIDVMVEREVVEREFSTANIGFMMAPIHHPAMRHVAGPRTELGTRTIFNLLGPLTNPAGVKRQLTGTFDRAWNGPMAKVLNTLGSEKAWLVHGSDGTDEVSITGLTWVTMLNGGQVSEREIHPEDAGLPIHSFDKIVGGTPTENAAALKAVLMGQTGAYRDAVLLNAAAALVVADKAGGLKTGVEIARESLDSGRARKVVETLVRLAPVAA